MAQQPGQLRVSYATHRSRTHDTVLTKDTQNKTHIMCLGRKLALCLQAPLPRVQKRARRLSKHLKDAIAQAAADRSVAPSGARVLQQMHRWKGVLKRIRCAHGNLYVWGHLAAYWAAAQTLATRVQRPVFGLAWDATRVDGKEMLFSALFFCSLLKWFWLPPQARVFVFCGRNTDAQNTQKTS